MEFLSREYLNLIFKNPTDIVTGEYGDNSDRDERYWAAAQLWNQSVFRVAWILLNSGYRRLNKQRSVFPSDTALLKALYLATHEITKKWTMPLRNWGRVLGELEVMYPDRLIVEET